MSRSEGNVLGQKQCSSSGVTWDKIWADSLVTDPACDATPRCGTVGHYLIDLVCSGFGAPLGPGTAKSSESDRCQEALIWYQAQGFGRSAGDSAASPSVPG